MKAIVPPKLSVNQKKALNIEINKQLSQNVRDLAVFLQAIVLWELHEQLGFGKKRLLRFQKGFLPKIKALQEYYDTRNADDTDFVCRYKLKNEVGIDVADLDSIFEFSLKLKDGEKDG